MNSRGSAIGIATGYGLDDRRVGIRVSTGSRFFTLSISSRSALVLTQAAIQWAQGLFSWEQSGRGAKLTTHFQLVPRSRKRGSTHPLLNTSSRFRV
jgi:hypothetical protein